MAQARARVPECETPTPARRAAPTYERVLAEARVKSGAAVVCADGVRRLDFVSGYGSVVLGWSDPDVERAAAAGGAHGRLEARLAEHLAALAPCAEAVAFRNSAPRALADALAAAKACTGRDGAFFCDEPTTAEGDLDAVEETLERHAERVAAVVVEPLDAPQAFLAGLRRLCDRHGAVLVFDETKSALRVHLGGVQALSGVRPDLAVFGPALANGRPLAAVAGSVAVLQDLPYAARVSDQALAAAAACLDKVARCDVAATLRVTGAEIAAEVDARLRASGAAALFDVCGDPVWSVVAPLPDAPGSAQAFREALSDALYAEGVLSYGAHVPNFAAGEREVSALLAAYDLALPRLMRDHEAGLFERRRKPRARRA